MGLLRFIEYITEAKFSGSKTSGGRRFSGTLVSKDRKEFRKLLRENVVTFKFQKRDGSIRKAKGTLYKDFLPKLKGTGRPKPSYQMVYFDLDKINWRSFRSFKFIKILSVEKVTDELAKEILKAIELAKEERKKKSTTPIHEEPKHIKHESDKHHEEIEHSKKHHDEHDEKHKTFDKGEKMSEKELLRRSTDFRKGTKKNELTHKANDKFKKGELDDEKHKTFDKGEKMSEEELLRRSTDFRKGTKKNKLTHKANDKFKKGELDED